MATATDPCTWQISPFQQRVMALPQDTDIFLGGGRGGAKSYLIGLLLTLFAEEHQQKARILYIRRNIRAVSDFESIMFDLVGRLKQMGRQISYNRHDHVFTWANGATIELNQLEYPTDYYKFQGRSFTLIAVDEMGQYPTPELIDKLRSNLRGAAGVPWRFIYAANPGDPGHLWIARRYVFGAIPWQPYSPKGAVRPTIYCPSTFRDNPFIDQAAYEALLRDAGRHDPELAQAWLSGDWSISRGAFFAGVLDEERNQIEPWPEPTSARKAGRETRSWPGWADTDWEWMLAYDHGTASPSATYVVAKSPGSSGPDGRWYPRGSLVLVDELATYESQARLNSGLNWTVTRVAEAILDLAKRWMIPSRGVADDEIFANRGMVTGTIAAEFSHCGVHWLRARKGRRAHGWEIMRRLLSDSRGTEEQPEKPGLYISRQCRYWWSTVPFLARDPRSPQDINSKQPDHAADATRYACVWTTSSTKLTMTELRF